jgi:glycosyltransferase involved in cell wall biosynthesis
MPMNAAVPGTIHVCHVITGLRTGGAEMMLLKLLSASDRTQFAHSVIVVGPMGPIGKRIEGWQVPVYPLNGSVARAPAALWRLGLLARRLCPDVVQGWMYHGNLAASLLSTLAPRCPPVVWGVRQTLYDISKEAVGTALAIRAGARLSWFAQQRVVYNSYVAKAQHCAFGYDPRRAEVIPNGFDTEQFAPSMAKYGALRQELGIPGDAVIIGMIARFHPMKGHIQFIRAAAMLAQSHRLLHFVMAGNGVSADNRAIDRLLVEHDLRDKVSLLGERSDIPMVMPALDILCMPSSWGEGFPNVVGEAMAAEVPCVVTRVGDAPSLVEHTGRIVRTDDVRALADGIAALVEIGADARRQMGGAARRRICEMYALSDVTRRYEHLYCGAVDASRSRAPRNAAAAE